MATTNVPSTADMLQKIRVSRQQLASSTFSPSSRRPRPVIVRLFIPAIVALVLLYVFLFVEVGEFDPFQFLHHMNPSSSQKLPQATTANSTETKRNTPNQAPVSSSVNGYTPEEDNSGFVAMWHYIHEQEFSELSAGLQTRKLHELFRYEYTKLLASKLTENKVKLPSDFELAEVMTALYSKWHDSEVNFIQIGACDGNWQESNDPIQRLILTKPNWHGVMMEPVPYLYETLVQNIKAQVVEYEHRILPINAALSDEDGTQKFFIVNPHFAEELPNESHALKHQIGSFNKDHIIKHIKIKRERGQLKEELDHYISAIDVQSLTPSGVLRLFQQSKKAARDGTIDVVSIDAEGYDYIVLKQFLEKTSMRPVLIMYENLHLSEDDNELARQCLQDHGYLDFKVGWNTLGIRVANI